MTARAATPVPIPAHFLRPREKDGSYPFLTHRTQAEIGK